MTNPYNVYTPYSLPIVGISNTQYAVVSFGVNHPYTLGEILSFRVSPQFGMREMNNLQGTVLAVKAKTVTVDINSTLFNIFVYPYATPVISPAQAIPRGSGIIPASHPPTVTLQDVFDNKPLM